MVEPINKLIMKKIISISLLSCIFIVLSCNESEESITNNAQIGGLLKPSSVSINYVVGNPSGPYTIEFLVQQSKTKVSEVRLFKSFQKKAKYTAISNGEEVIKDTLFFSNEILQQTIPITKEDYHFISTSYDLTDLTEGLKVVSSVAGTANDLTTDELTYSIGDKWVFRIESVLSDNRVVEQAYNIGVTVSTRYAGTYKVTDAARYNGNTQVVDVSGWANPIIIESIDAVTYRVTTFAYFEDEDQDLFFTVNPITLEISYPENKPNGDAQNFRGLDFATCATDPSLFTAIDCSKSNKAINDNVGGKDVLLMTFGYDLSPAAGDQRQFFQNLIKQ
jgi:hypothetical protein